MNLLSTWFSKPDYIEMYLYVQDKVRRVYITTDKNLPYGYQPQFIGNHFDLYCKDRNQDIVLFNNSCAVLDIACFLQNRTNQAGLKQLSDEENKSFISKIFYRVLKFISLRSSN